MKKTAIYMLMLLTIVSLTCAYEYKDENGYNIYMDFTNGGAEIDAGDTNQSVVIGSTMLLPFNSTGVGYDIHQGTLYIIWSNVNLGVDITSPTVNCTVSYRGVEWGELNCTASEIGTWSMSILENETHEYVYMFDGRTEGQRKFVGLKEDTRYTVQINVTDTAGNKQIISEQFKTRLSGEHLSMLVAFIIGPLLLCFFFIYWANSLSEEQEPLKWFMRLLSVIMIYVMFVAANIAANSDPDYANYAALFDLKILGYIMYTIFAVFLIWFIYKIFISFKQKKTDDFEQGRL